MNQKPKLTLNGNPLPEEVVEQAVQGAVLCKTGKRDRIFVFINTEQDRAAFYWSKKKDGLSTFCPLDPNSAMYRDEILFTGKKPDDPKGELAAIAQYLDEEHLNGNINPKNTVEDYYINLRLWGRTPEEAEQEAGKVAPDAPTLPDVLAAFPGAVEAQGPAGGFKKQVVVTAK